MQTVADILSGEVAERPNRAAHLMTESEARGILRDIERQMPRKRRGVTVYKFATSPHGRLSVAARNLYLAYAAAYGVN